jgi:hypothetical protein
MKYLSTHMLSTHAKYKVFLMRKKDVSPIFARKIGRGFKLLKITYPTDSEEFKKEERRLEAEGWSLVLGDE